MSKKELLKRIEQLELEIVGLKQRMAVLEAGRVIYTQQPDPRPYYWEPVRYTCGKDTTAVKPAYRSD